MYKDDKLLSETLERREKFENKITEDLHVLSEKIHRLQFKQQQGQHLQQKDINPIVKQYLIYKNKMLSNLEKMEDQLKKGDRRLFNLSKYIVLDPLKHRFNDFDKIIKPLNDMLTSTAPPLPQQ